jgi:galactokinase
MMTGPADERESAGADTGDPLVQRCEVLLRGDGAGGDRPRHAFFVPGRIEVLGKHTDYGGGRSLVAAVDRGIRIVATPREDSAVRVTDAVTGARVAFEMAADLTPGDGWVRYPMTVARRLARDWGAPLAGADIAFASNLPPAAGLSSSSALVTAVYLVLAAINRLDTRAAYRARITAPERLADYLAAIENGRPFHGLGEDIGEHVGVGTEGGSEDHTAILCARPGALVQYAYAPARFERAVRVPAGVCFVIAVSGMTAEKAGAARVSYNDAARRLQAATALWNARTGRADATLGAVLHAAAADVTEADSAARVRAVLRAAADDALFTRVEQFIAETVDIVPAGADALARGDLAAFGALADWSQALAAAALGNQVPETVALAASARRLGALAASAFGAGFGGSVWALVTADGADAFTTAWRAAYVERFPRRAADADFFATRAGRPAHRILTAHGGTAARTGAEP